MLFILVVGAVEIYNSRTLLYSPILNGLSEPVFWLFAYTTGRFSIHDISGASHLLKRFCLPIFVVAPLAFAQTLGFPPVLELTTSLVTADGFERAVDSGGLLRATGLIGGWTSFGAYLTGIFAVSLALLFLAHDRNESATAYPYAVAILSMGTTLTTLTFSTGIAVAILFLAALLRLGIRPGMVVGLTLSGIAAVSILGPYISERFGQQHDGRQRFVEWLPSWTPNTIGYRVHVWTEQTLPAIAERPTTGWGARVYDATLGSGELFSIERITPSTLRWTSPESQWFSTLMTGGVLSLAALICLITACAFILRKGVNSSQSRWLASPLWWLFLTNVGIAFTAMSLTNKGLPGVLWPFVGMVAALSVGSTHASGPGAKTDGKKPRGAVREVRHRTATGSTTRMVAGPFRDRSDIDGKV